MYQIIISNNIMNNQNRMNKVNHYIIQYHQIIINKIINKNFNNNNQNINNNQRMRKTQILDIKRENTKNKYNKSKNN